MITRFSLTRPCDPVSAALWVPCPGVTLVSAEPQAFTEKRIRGKTFTTDVESSLPDCDPFVYIGPAR